MKNLKNLKINLSENKISTDCLDKILSITKENKDLEILKLNFNHNVIDSNNNNFQILEKLKNLEQVKELELDFSNNKLKNSN